LIKQYSSTNNLLDSALWYASLSWLVLPIHSVTPGQNGELVCTCGSPKCSSPGKHPLSRNGLKDATIDENQIRIWWTQWPWASIGIRTGRQSGFFALDIDPRHGGTDSLTELITECGPLSDTAVSGTGGGGKHILFQYSDDTKIRSRVKLLPGIDVRAENGYLIVPPSLHISGNNYRWITSSSVAPPTPSLIEFLTQPNRVAHESSIAPSSLYGTQQILEGERNETLIQMAGLLRARGFDKNAIQIALLQINMQRCEPPLAESEIVKIADSAAHYPPDFTFNDTGNSRRLVFAFGKFLRFCHPLEKWLIWDGSRWLFDEDGEVMRLAKHTAASLWVESLMVNDKKLSSKFNKWAMQSHSLFRLEAAVKLASTEPGIAVRVEQLDADAMLLGVSNGVIDLRTGTVREPMREDYITKQATVEFKSGVKCPIWDQFLDRITNSNDEIKGFLKRMVGYTLTGKTTEQCIFVLHGVGANGKTSFTNTIKRLLGDYAAMTSPDALMVRKYGGGATPELARLRGARAVFAAEAEDGQRLAESRIKQLAGEDTILVRDLYQSPFEMTPTFKVVLSTNHKPLIRGDDQAIWRRIRLIPFEITIPPDERDPRYASGEIFEKELHGILNWAIAGCLEWQQAGLSPPKKVVVATEAYRTEMDTFGQWIEECCETGNQSEAPVKVLYGSYSDWCEESGLSAMSKQALGRKLGERGYMKRHTAKGNVYGGIAIRDDAPPGDLPEYKASLVPTYWYEVPKKSGSFEFFTWVEANDLESAEQIVRQWNEKNGLNGRLRGLWRNSGDEKQADQ